MLPGFPITIPRSLVVCVISGLALVWGTDIPSEPVLLGQRLAAEIDLAAPGLEAVATAVKAKRYDEALTAWRDAKVAFLRGFDPGPFSWHDDQQSKRRLSFADFAVGKITREAYEDINPPKSSFFVDRYGIHGDGPIDWLPESAPLADQCDYHGFAFAIPFGVRYWQTGEVVYLKKFFQVTQDFVLRQRDLVMRLPERDRVNLMCGWTTSAGSALAQGDRVTNLVRILCLVAKSLPDGNPPAPWKEVEGPRTVAVPKEVLTRIPADALAQIAVSLLHDHSEALCQLYLKAGAIPNQRRNGLAAMMLACGAFPEFRAARELRLRAAKGMMDYLSGSFWADGGMLEQSFNYNQGDAGSLGLVAQWVRADLPSLADQLIARQVAFRRLMAAVQTPLGTPPAMSSAGPPNPPPVWRDVAARASWLAAQEQARAQGDGLGTKAFTSVAFPYSGYYVQRNGWEWSSAWLFFQGSRPSRGHSTQGANAIQVCAYGRPLLVTAGVPVYEAEQLPVPLRGEFHRINELLGEESSWKVNTILVDGGSQLRPKGVLQAVADAPVQARFAAGPALDYLEGTYEGGYTSGAKDVTHRRQVIFLREPGVWLMVDTMLARDGKAHAYDQNWIFPGAGSLGNRSVAGFPAQALVIQDDRRVIRTTDPTGPNISLIHVGQQMVYRQQFGARDPWRGWFTVGFGSLVPAHQAQATFHGQGTSVLITVIAPRALGVDQDPEVVDLHPGTHGDAAGCSVVMAGGWKAILEVADKARDLQAGNLSANAQLVMSLEGPKGTAGLVITPPGMPGSRSIFRSPQGASVTTDVQVPSGFAWTGDPPTNVSYQESTAPTGSPREKPTRSKP